MQTRRSSCGIAIQRKWARQKGVWYYSLLNLWISISGAFTVVQKSPFTASRSLSHIELFQSPAKKDSDELLSILDELILLHSLVPNPDDESETDIGSLRKREIVDLIEDVARSLPADNGCDDDEIEELAEIGRQLDETILMGYQSNFSKEEEEEWIKNIQNLSSEYEKRLERTDDLSVVLRKPKKRKITNVDQLSDRLDQMKTLIAPLGLKPSVAGTSTPKEDSLELTPTDSKTPSSLQALPETGTGSKTVNPNQAENSYRPAFSTPEEEKLILRQNIAELSSKLASAESKKIEEEVDGKDLSTVNVEIDRNNSALSPQANILDGGEEVNRGGAIFLVLLVAIGAVLMAPPDLFQLPLLDPSPIIDTSL